MDAVQRIIEIERVVNLVRGFGWEKTEEAIEGDTIKLTFEKTIQSPAPGESE